MRQQTVTNTALAAAEDPLAALYGQMRAIRQAMDAIALNRENGKLSEQGKNGFKLTKQEIKTMPEHIRKIFIANNYIVNYRITTNGYFEARIRRKGLYVEASGRDFETMRRRFMDRLATFYAQPTVTAEPAISSTPSANTILFGDYGREWLKIKEQTTKPSTFKEYERSFRVDLEPTFGSKPLADITRNDLQNYLFGIVGENKHRKVSLTSVFIKDEEARLVNYCKSHREVEGTDALLVLLYFGLRKSELASIEIIDGKWLQCETSKERLGQNVVLRKIPFTPMEKKVLPYIDFEKAKNTNLNTISTRMKRLLPNHHPHELRHTFISRCKEAGVASEVVSIWAGHSLSGTITSTVYTHYSEEFQLKEAEKVVY